MLVTWDPEDGSDKQTWQFNPGDVLRTDAQAIEKHYGGGSWDQWVQGLRVGEVQARAVLLWYMLKQVHSKLRFEDVPDFRVRQLQVEMGVQELKELFLRAKRMKMDPETREMFESQFEADMADAMARDGIDGTVAIIDGQLAIEGGPADLPKAP